MDGDSEIQLQPKIEWKITVAWNARCWENGLFKLLQIFGINICFSFILHLAKKICQIFQNRSFLFEIKNKTYKINKIIIWVKVFKNGKSEISASQRLKNLKEYGLL